MEELKRPKLPIHRVEFHEITKKGVEHGVAHPRKLDDNLYDAQRARRVLDRIVGYDVSALVWSKLAFGLSAGRVQSVALRLIVDLGSAGGPVGLITYMRTDSLRVSEDAIQELRVKIAELYGADHLPEQPNRYKAKKNAQEAHEAIRPTSMELPPESIRKHLKDEQYKLYKLIWDRFVASQMSPAVYDQTGVDIEATVTKKGAHATYGLRASGRV